MIQWTRQRFVGLILLIAGVIVATIVSFWDSPSNEVLSQYSGDPYLWTVAICALFIVTLGLFFLIPGPKKNT